MFLYLWQFILTIFIAVWQFDFAFNYLLERCIYIKFSMKHEACVAASCICFAVFNQFSSADNNEVGWPQKLWATLLMWPENNRTKKLPLFLSSLLIIDWVPAIAFFTKLAFDTFWCLVWNYYTRSWTCHIDNCMSWNFHPSFYWSALVILIKKEKKIVTWVLYN